MPPGLDPAGPGRDENPAGEPGEPVPAPDAPARTHRRHQPLAQLPRRRLARNRQHGCGPALLGEADIWRPEGSSAARPSRPVPASSWLVAATVIPAEDFTRNRVIVIAYTTRLLVGRVFLCPSPRRTVDEVRVWVWPPSGRPVQGQFPIRHRQSKPEAVLPVQRLYVRQCGHSPQYKR